MSYVSERGHHYSQLCSYNYNSVDNITTKCFWWWWENILGLKTFFPSQSKTKTKNKKEQKLAQKSDTIIYITWLSSYHFLFVRNRMLERDSYMIDGKWQVLYPHGINYFSSTSWWLSSLSEPGIFAVVRLTAEYHRTQQENITLCTRTKTNQILDTSCCKHYQFFSNSVRL